MNVYGPVPSRRLGYSLGVDLLPFKTCSFDCIYCQLGRTTRKTVRRKEFFSAPEILSQIKRVLAEGKEIDCITFSGSGEPTLSTALRAVIAGIKKMTSIPVVVLTNSSLLTRREVREALLQADIVVPTVDAATQAVFLKVHRPHASLKVEKILAGLERFRREFRGEIWLEVMLVKGINDRPSHLKKLKELFANLKPDRIHLNTVVRPPAEERASPVSRSELRKIQEFLGPTAEVIADFKRKELPPAGEGLAEAIVSALRRRPMTLHDLRLSLGKTPGLIKECLSSLLRKRKIKAHRHKGAVYYKADGS